MKASFYEFTSEEDVCKFLNENCINPISIVYRDYKYILFYYNTNINKTYEKIH